MFKLSYRDKIVKNSTILRKIKPETINGDKVKIWKELYTDGYLILTKKSTMKTTTKTAPSTNGAIQTGCLNIGE